jgi:hypothetical protein
MKPQVKSVEKTVVGKIVSLVQGKDGTKSSKPPVGTELKSSDQRLVGGGRGLPVTRI